MTTPSPRDRSAEDHATGSVPASVDLPVLEYLERTLAGTLLPEHRTHMRYPTAISQTLGFRLVDIGEGIATIHADSGLDRFTNQQGTIHGGFLTELADAAIGTACSTLINPGESFTSLNLSATFIRPFWEGTLIAEARPTHIGSTISHWYCEIVRGDNQKTIMTATSMVMNLRGDRARGR